MLRDCERVACSRLFDDANHFRDHVAAAFDENSIADLHAKAHDLILVV